MAHRGLGTPTEVAQYVKDKREQAQLSGLELGDYMEDVPPAGSNEFPWARKAIALTDPQRGKPRDVNCPHWNAKDIASWPGVRRKIDKWSRLSNIPPEQQAETLMMNLEGDAELARRHLTTSDVSWAGGLTVVIATLDAMAYMEADSEKFDQFERTVYGPPRGRGENMSRAEQQRNRESGTAAEQSPSSPGMQESLSD